jgi:hypothetical protein
VDAFELPAFRAGYGGEDPAAWAAFHAEEAEWVECRYSAPPAAPHRMEGRDRIRVALEQVVAAGLKAELSDVIIAPGRTAFHADVELPDGRRIVEHRMVWPGGGSITRQVDAEAWDPTP